eukprot:2650003-Prymnesium_polylepis.1
MPSRRRRYLPSRKRSLQAIVPLWANPPTKAPVRKPAKAPAPANDGTADLIKKLIGVLQATPANNNPKAKTQDPDNSDDEEESDEESEEERTCEQSRGGCVNNYSGRGGHGGFTEGDHVGARRVSVARLTCETSAARGRRLYV